MARPSQAPEGPRTPEDWLLTAVRTRDPEEKVLAAKAGLAKPSIAPDTRVLLERQVYMGRLEQRRFRQALIHANRMIAVGVLKDIAYHDAARVQALLGEFDAAIASQRLAARVAHPERRSFHRWSLATFQHFAGRPDEALATLTRAMRSSTRDRPLLKAHALYVRLDAGLPTRGAESIVASLRAAPSREGYGRFLLGMIAFLEGDSKTARAELGAFLARNEAADPGRGLTLREELRRARLALGRIAPD